MGNGRAIVNCLEVESLTFKHPFPTRGTKIWVFDSKSVHCHRNDIHYHRVDIEHRRLLVQLLIIVRHSPYNKALTPILGPMRENDIRALFL